MKLFIAEKPSMGKEIAQTLGVKKRSKGSIECQNGDIVTWLFGHILEMLEPQEYDPAYKKWRLDTLPFVPQEWKLKVKKDAAGQFKVVSSLIKKADRIVHAGDIDREGQLLVDEVLEYVGNKKPTQRILLSSLDTKSIQKALADLKDNADYQNMKNAALARARADFLIGINGTRAMTLVGQRQGYSGVLSMGRVQTPTLALVVQRDREIENFKPKDYFVPKIEVQHANGVFLATWHPQEDSPGLDPEGRLIQQDIGQKLVDAAKQAGQGRIAQCEAVKKTKAAPLPHSLTTLQKAANAAYGLSAAATLEAAQGLYEKKITTYPRSECQYLTDEHYAESGKVISSLKGNFKELAGANPSLKSKAFNTGKVTEHHAIIPTGASPSGLNQAEQQVFQLVVTAYAQQFYPAMEYLSKTVLIEMAGQLWKATGKTVLNPGWTVVGKQEQKKGDEQNLPEGMEKEDPVSLIKAMLEAKKTKPPAHFTEGTLIDAMGGIHRFVTNPKIKKMLKETAGIGTPATRAAIIEILLKRNYMERSGKKVLSTAIGRNLVDATPSGFADPGITALWEQVLSSIEEGKASLDDFVRKQVDALPLLIEQIEQAKIVK